MEKAMKGIIEEKLCLLVKQPLIDIGRASSLLWLMFGQKIITINRKGNESLKGKYALNVQCSWRISQEGRIIVASKDIFIPRTGLERDMFDWEKYGDNRFDERISGFKTMIEKTDMLVSKVSVDDIGGFMIDFETGIKFELFPDDSLNDEFWRFIINGDGSEHFVVFRKEDVLE